MSDFIITSLRGGLNNSDPSISLSEDQCTVANNVEWIKSMLGERRRGATAIDITGSGLVGHDKVTLLYRHLPTTSEADAELWALGVTGTSSATLVRKTSSWATVTMTDAATLTTVYPFQWSMLSLHGKLFVAYKSGVNRLHVADGAAATALRRTGLAEPAAPTGANTGIGTYAGTRYVRVRYVVVSGSTVLRRSKPSDTLTFSPSGTGLSLRVTKPASISESETHWEVEFSTDNANFYRLARLAVATTTYDDSTVYSSGYANASGAVLSADVEDYALIPSARYLVADEDRLIWGGNYENTAQSSRIGWTPVYGSVGDGNDERMEMDTDPFVDLDTFEGGDLTGLSNPTNGAFYAFKINHIYKLVRSGRRTKAYDVIALTKKRGALHGSVVDGIDQMGRPCVYFLDSAVGPCRLGANGLLPCGEDIRETWKTLNINATQVACRALYYPESRQVHWWIATDASNVPNVHVVLQVSNTRETEDGVRRGWSIWTGPTASILAACLFSDNIDDDTSRNKSLRPFYGMTGSGLIWRGDTGDDDNGTEYSSRIVTKPFAPKSLLHHTRVMSGILLGKAVTGASIDVKAIRDFGLETLTVSGVGFTPTASETEVIKNLDNLSFSELRTVQFEFVDVATPGPRWELNGLALRLETGQKA
jgi:hypothetical protein